MCKRVAFFLRISISYNTPYCNVLFFRDERKWRKWVDDVYVHVLSPNVYRSPSEAFEAFQWFSKVSYTADLLDMQIIALNVDCNWSWFQDVSLTQLIFL